MRTGRGAERQERLKENAKSKTTALESPHLETPRS